MKAAEQAALLDPAGQLFTSRFVPAAVRAHVSYWIGPGLRSPRLTTTKPDVSVPHARAALRVRVHVPLDHDRARSCTQVISAHAPSTRKHTPQ